MHRIVLCAAVLSGLFAGRAGAQDELVFSAYEAPGLTPVALEHLEEAYANLGIGVGALVTGPSRALVSSSRAETDGEVARIAEVGDRYPSLIRVNVPLVSISTYAYTNRPDILHVDHGSRSALRVGHVRGAIFGELAARGFSEIWTEDGPDLLFAMLEQQRLDIVFVSEDQAQKMIDLYGFDHVRPIPSSRRDHQFFHYLHVRHWQLVPRVEQALTEVLEERFQVAAEEPS